MYDFFLVFGCFGFKIDDFVDCPSVENIILKVDASLIKYNDIMEYFDNCRLFDKPLLEFNAIKHFIYNLQDRFDQIDRHIWSQKKFELLQKFVIDHRHCGLYIKLVLPDEYIEQSHEEVVSRNERQISSPLKLIRGKR